MSVITWIPVILVILAFIWGFWLIFRRGDIVTQPVRMIGYFLGALVALVLAGIVTVFIFPAWAHQLLDLAGSSPSVQNFQRDVQGIFQRQVEPYVGTPTPVVSPVLVPINPGASGLSVTPAAGQVVYTVQRGDTLYSIARKYGVRAQAIQALNGITDPNKISVGQRLLIPSP